MILHKRSANKIVNLLNNSIYPKLDNLYENVKGALALGETGIDMYHSTENIKLQKE